MRMIEIETKKGTVLINPKQITSIRNFEGTVMIAMADGHSVAASEFRTIEDVFGYIKEGANYSTRFTRRMDAEAYKYRQKVEAHND